MNRKVIAAVAAVILWPMLTASSCATTGGPPPEPKIVVQKVLVPVATPCTSDPGAEPDFPDTDAAMQAAPGIFERVQLLLAGKKLREADRRAARDAWAVCARPAPPPPDPRPG